MVKQKSRKKKRRKKGKAQGTGHQTTEGHTTPTKTSGRDEIDTAVEEVNKLLGGRLTLAPATGPAETARLTARPILTVDKRYVLAILPPPSSYITVGT